MEMTEKPSLGAAMAAELMIGFWFGIGVILAAKMVHSLEYCIEELISENKVTANKMAEQNQVMTKDPKKVEAGKRLAEYNHRKREELKAQNSESKQVLTSSQCYSIGAVLALGVIGGLGYYIYQAKKGEVNAVNNVVPSQQPPKANKFEME